MRKDELQPLFTTGGAGGFVRDGRDPLSGIVIDAAITVHSRSGPGLLESVYQAAIVIELHRRRIEFAAGYELPIVYDGVELERRFSLDLLVAGELVVELKSVQESHPIHTAELLT